MGFVKEFKEFAMRGSVVDLAIGVVIGAAFGKIVTSMVDDLIMPSHRFYHWRNRLFANEVHLEGCRCR